MPQEEFFKKQVQYFNKVLMLFIAILVIMSIVIASLIMLKFQEIKIVDDLDQTIRDTLEEYAPDREKQEKSRQLIENNSQLNIEVNKTTIENNQLLKQLVANSSAK